MKLFNNKSTTRIVLGTFLISLRMTWDENVLMWWHALDTWWSVPWTPNLQKGQPRVEIRWTPVRRSIK